jgi:predicted dehydrogenase
VNDNPLKVGLIGPGSISRLHLDGIRRNPDAELVAIAASSSEKAQEIARDWRVPFAYGDYRQLLDNDQIDVVHVATRNQTHAEISSNAIKAGKHVICEKPLGCNTKETASLLKDVSTSNLVHALCHNLRFYPLVHQLRTLVMQGELGRIHTVHGSYLQDWLCMDTAYNWRLDPKESGELSTTSDIGSHWLDLVQFITGLQITSVISHLQTVIPVRRISNKSDQETNVTISNEDSACVLLELDTNVMGTLLVSQVAHGHKNILSIEVNGTKASAAWNTERPNELWLGYRDKPNQVMISDASLLSDEAKAVAGPGHTKGIMDTWHQFLKSVYAEIRSNKKFDPNRVTFANFIDGHRNVVILEAIITSHRTKSWQLIEA